MTEFLKTLGRKKKTLATDSLAASFTTLIVDRQLSPDEAARKIQEAYKGHKQVKELDQAKKKKTQHELFLEAVDDQGAPEFQFNTRPGNVFSALNAYWLARASFLVYYDDETVKKEVLEVWKFDECKFIDVNDTQVFVALKRKHRNADGSYGTKAADNATGEDVDKENLVIVCWRGTESRGDIMTDLNIQMVTGPFGKVHKGFNKAFLYAWRQVLDTVAEYCGGMDELRQDPDDATKPRQTSIWSTGHSLGAALATLTAAYLLKDNIKLDGLYTFGQPRTGDLAFAQALDQSYLLPRHYRFVNRADRVPRNPMRIMGFAHCGRLLYFDDQGGLFDTFALVKDADQHLNANGFGLLVNGSGKDVGAWKSKYDHSIGNYVKRMNLNLETVLLQVPMLMQLTAGADDVATIRASNAIPEPRGPSPAFMSKAAPGIADTLKRSGSQPKLHSPRHSAPPSRAPSPLSRAPSPLYAPDSSVDYPNGLLGY